MAYLSRLGRNVSEQLRTWDRVEAAGGEIVSVREGIDTTTAAGRLHRNILISIDAHEREQHAERFDERRRHATEAGIWQRRQTPRGYRKNADRRLEPNSHADQVSSAFQDFLGGETVSELAARLAMTPGGVRHLLRNRVYLGELRVGRYCNPEAHPPILDLPTFDAVQHKLGHAVRPPRSNDGPALLAGLVRCAACGHIMTRGSRSKRHGRSYVCVKRHSGGECPAPAAVATDRIDRFVESVSLTELSRLRVEANSGPDVENLHSAVAAAQAELDAYLDAVRAADVGADAFAAGARKRSSEIEAAKHDLFAAMARTPSSASIQTGAEAWDGLDAHERNALLRGLLDAVVVRAVGRGRKVPIQERVRIVPFGSSLALPRQRGHLASGLVPIPFDDLDDDVGVLAAVAPEDRA